MIHAIFADGSSQHSLVDTVGIIAACIPTLRPLFGNLARYPTSIRTFINRVTGRSGKSQDEDTHRLDEISNKRPPLVSHSSSSANGAGSIEGGQWPEATDEGMSMGWD